MSERTNDNIRQDFLKTVNLMNANRKEMKEIQKRKAFKIIELMSESKSVKEAEMKWNITEDGQREIELKYEYDGMKAIKNALNAEKDIINHEYFG